MTPRLPSCFLIVSLALAAPLTSVAQDTPLPPNPDSPDVKESIIYDLEDRLLTIQKVTEETIPILLPLPEPDAPVQQAPTPQTEAERQAELHSHTLSIGGTVFRQAPAPSRSLITIHPNNGGNPIEIWSSIDWNLLTPGNFTSPDGESYSLQMMISTVNVSDINEADPGAPSIAIPSFSNGAASYKIVSGIATAQMIKALNDLHAAHDREYVSLLAQWQAREVERSASEAADKLPKPPPEDILTQYREMKPEEMQKP